MSQTLSARLDKHESLAEEAKRKGTARADDNSLPNWLNVKKQLVFYASYHSHPVNVAIHLVCIPTILWSFLLLLAHVPLPDHLPTSYPLPDLLNPTSKYNVVKWALRNAAPVHRFGKYFAFQPNLALVMNSLYTLYYIALEPVGGLLYVPWAIISQLTITAMATDPSVKSKKLSGLLQLGGWLAQFAGHGFAEGRAPALLDNLLQAVVLAPFFSHLELLFFLGYNPKLQKQIHDGVEADKRLRAARKGKKVA